MTAQHPLLLRVVWACPLLKETSSGKSSAGSHREIQKKYAIEGLTPRGSTMRTRITLEKSKMNELVKLRQQIADMEKQAADLQKKTRPAVLAELREQMAAYGITAEELSRPAAKAARPKAARRRQRACPRARSRPCPRPRNTADRKARSGPAAGRRPNGSMSCWLTAKPGKIS